MLYFVNHLFTYSAKNKACKELLDFIKQFEYVQIQNECSLDALCIFIEEKISEINMTHPKLRPIHFERDNSSGRISASIKPLTGSPDYIFFMDICQVRGTFCFSEKAQDIQLQKLAISGICKECGCTEKNPCFHPNHGTCWWANEEHTLCSHCADSEIKDDPQTEHCINTLEDEQL